MYKIRKNDTVEVTKGKDRGKRGRVLEIVKADKKAVVEGVNTVKKHRRRTQQDQTQHGIITIEMPISLSNISLVCKQCNRPVKIGFQVVAGGEKQRYCKTCKESL